MKSVVVTGVSTGIGLATVESAVRAGFRVFGSVRTEADAVRLRETFTERFTALVFDVTDVAAIAEAVEVVGRALGTRRLDGLVNNAGIAISGPLLHLPLEKVRQQFEVNLIGVVAVTQAFAPLLGTDDQRSGEPGKIINISSVAGKFGSPFVGAYSASKHALEGMSESLRRELLLYGIDVVVIGPGAIQTPIWGKADFVDYFKTPYRRPLELAYAGMLKLVEGGLKPEQCGDLIVKCLCASSPKARYALVRNSLVNWIIPRVLPVRWIDWIFGRMLELRQRSIG